MSRDLNTSTARRLMICVAALVAAPLLVSAADEPPGELTPLTATQPAASHSAPAQPKLDAPATNDSEHGSQAQSSAPTNTSTSTSNQPAAKPAHSGAMDSDPEPRHSPSATDVIKQLLNDENRPSRQVVLPNRPSQPRPEIIAAEAMPKNNVVPVNNKLMPDGYRLVDRSGRLVREGDFYVFSFESRGQTQADAPIRLLPNRLLEDMEAASEGGTRAVVFIVSGEVTEYHGVNYLLLQKLLTRPNLGNLR